VEEVDKEENDVGGRERDVSNEGAEAEGWDMCVFPAPTPASYVALLQVLSLLALLVQKYNH
jgi:hypothetical protein